MKTPRISATRLVKATRLLLRSSKLVRDAGGVFLTIGLVLLCLPHFPGHGIGWSYLNTTREYGLASAIIGVGLIVFSIVILALPLLAVRVRKVRNYVVMVHDEADQEDLEAAVQLAERI